MYDGYLLSGYLSNEVSFKCSLVALHGTLNMVISLYLEHLQPSKVLFPQFHGFWDHKYISVELPKFPGFFLFIVVLVGMYK